MCTKTNLNELEHKLNPMNSYPQRSLNPAIRNSAQMRTQVDVEPLKIILLLLLHMGLAYLMRTLTIVATVHGWAVLLVGVWIALTAKDERKIIPVVAYITGAEVLWRMTSAAVLWEFGKYATAAILIISLLRRKKALNNAALPILFIVLFLPSIILTIDAFGLTEMTRELISFNLSGPLTTGIFLLYCLQLEMDDQLVSKTVWNAVYPITGILFLAFYSTITATQIEFGSESIFRTSGGYGPNQVSAVLGLGALLLIMLSIQPGKRKGRLLGFILALGLITQSFLTFSRGGIYNFVIALGGALLMLAFKGTRSFRGLIIVLVFALIVGFLVIPQLEQLTSGAFSARFTDTDLATRGDLAQADLMIFQENPLIGVGPGMAEFQRSRFQIIANHTEYSRILAEHGSLGALALLILVYYLFRAFFKAPGVFAKAWVVAFAFWATVEMAHSAMRIVAIPLMLGLAVVTWKKDGEPSINH